MKGDKNNRRKSTNNLVHKGDIGYAGSRIIGQPYEQAVPRPKKEHKGTKNSVVGAKSLLVSDQIKVEKHKKDNQGGKIVSAKQRIPRFSSEQMKDRYIVPSLWHKAEERAIKNHQSKGVLNQLQKASKGSKKAKLNEGRSQRGDSQTPNEIQRNSSQQFEIDQMESKQKTQIPLILAHSNNKQHRFKRQRSNSSEQSQKQPKKVFAESQSQSLDVNNNSAVKVRAELICQKQQDLSDSQYVLDKPIAFGQPVLSEPKSKIPVQGSAMLQLLTNTTIHLKEEADRISKETPVQKNKQPKSQMMTANRKSRESNTYLHKKNEMKSERGLQDYQQKIDVPATECLEVNDSANLNFRDGANVPQQKQKAATTDFRSHENIKFKSKYPSTRLKTEDEKQNSKLSKNMTEVEDKSIQHQIVREHKISQKTNIKRKPVSALDEDYNRLFPAPTFSAGRAYSKLHLSAATTGSSQPKSVAMSMNSIKAERVTRLSQNEEGDYLQRQSEHIKRLTMPQIAQTPHVGLSTKYHQQNISKLSSAKQKQIQTSQSIKQTSSKIINSSDKRNDKATKCEIVVQRASEQNHFTVQSPQNNNTKERRQFFDHGRASRSKTIKTYYPALNNGATSSTTNIHTETDANTQQTEGQLHKKVQMPKLQAKQSSSIQNSNVETILSLQKDNSSIVGPTFIQPINPNIYNPPVYKTAAPKFIAAATIKMHQAKAQASKQSGSATASTSIRNLHTNLNNNGIVQTAFKRVLGGNRANLVKPRHILHSSSSEDESSEEKNGSQIDNREETKQNDLKSEMGDDDETNVIHSDTEKELANEDSPLLNDASNEQQNEAHSSEQVRQYFDLLQLFFFNCISRVHQSQKQEQSNQNSNPAGVDQNTNNSTGLPPITNGGLSNEPVKETQPAAGKTIETKKKTKKYKMPKLIFNLMYTVYPIIKKVAKSHGFRVRTDDIQLVPPLPNTEEYLMRQSGYLPQGPPPDFDVSWIDNPIVPEVLSKVKPYQRISQFPGISVISNKKKLASGLMKMFKRFPDDFNFFPQTYVLPVEYMEFKAQFEKYARQMHGNSAKKSKPSQETYIIKPENLCQGKGIFLVKDPLEVDPNDNCVAQKYIMNPFLIDDLKFDLRLYVLVYGVNPLRIFLFKEGLVRLATEPYVKPTEDNIDNLFMHLTNYAINKNNDNFVQNSAADSDDDMHDDGTHKRSLSSLYYTLKCMGKPYKKLKQDINDILIKTLIVSQPSLSHLYKSCQPDDLENQLCFQILGFDIMIDEDCKPWLIEVNQSPSFKADSGLDKRIKTQLVNDTINLLNLSARRKQKWITQNKQVMQKRMLTGKKVKLTQEERESKLSAIQASRDSYEKANLGKFKLIYPSEDVEQMANYDKLLEASTENWEDFTTGKRRKNQGFGMNSTNARAAFEQQNGVTALDANGKPIWKGSGNVVNYMPAWERNFQKSLQQKAARLNSLQHQNSGENQQEALTAQQIEMTSARGAQAQQTSNPFKSSQASRTTVNKVTDKSKGSETMESPVKRSKDVMIPSSAASKGNEASFTGQPTARYSNQKTVATSQFMLDLNETGASNNATSTRRGGLNTTQMMTREVKLQECELIDDCVNERLKSQNDVGSPSSQRDVQLQSTMKSQHSQANTRIGARSELQSQLEVKSNNEQSQAQV